MENIMSNAFSPAIFDCSGTGKEVDGRIQPLPNLTRPVTRGREGKLRAFARK